MDWQKFIDGELAVEVTPDNIESFLWACDEHDLRWRMIGEIPPCYIPDFRGAEALLIACNTVKSPQYMSGLSYILATDTEIPRTTWENE